MATIQPQNQPQNTPGFKQIPQANPGKPLGWWQNLGAQLKAMVELPEAQINAQEAQDTAVETGHTVANETGKPISVATPSSPVTPAPAAPKTSVAPAVSKPATSPIVPSAAAATAPVNPPAPAPAPTGAGGNAGSATPPVVVPKTSPVAPTAASASTSSQGATANPGLPPPGASVADTQAFYASHPYYLQPGESASAYLARTQNGTNATGGGGGTSEPAGEDFMSPEEQSGVADDMAGMSPEDLNSGGAAMEAFNGATSPAGDDLTSGIESEMDDIMNDFGTPPPSLLTAYNNLLASSGITEDQQAQLNLETIMNGTTDDVRSELTANGGFATESQIQAMASARNVNLQRQYNMLTDALTVKQNYVNAQMQYTQADESAASSAFEEKYSLIDNLQGTLAKLQATDATTYAKFQTAQMSQLSTLLKYGTKLSSDQIAAYSAATGIDPTTLTNAMTSADARYSLTNQLDNSLVAYRNTETVKSGTKLMTATDIDSTTQAQLMSDITSGNYSASQLVAAYPDVDPTYVEAQITAMAQ